MARISELHYSNAYARTSGVSEFLEVSLGPGENPADYTVTFYQANGNAGFEITLDTPGVQVTYDPETGETAYVISADVFPILLTDPNGGGANNYEAYALTQTGSVPATVIDFYDIGGGTTNIVANGGAADGAVSQNLPVLVGPNATTTTLQFNQPNPDTLTYGTVAPGDTGMACFVAGTPIDTAEGPVLVERLRPGMRVRTADHGFQPVQWCASSTVRGQGRHAPIVISAGAHGATRDILLSPRHRVLFTGWQAELLFGETEVLVPAKALVDGQTVRQQPCDLVRYVHFMFDRHEVVFSAGLASESFYPGAQAIRDLPSGTRAELLELFPELASGPASYTGPARQIPSTGQANLLRAS